MKQLNERNVEIGERLRKCRRELGISVDEAVRKIGFNSWKELCRIENGIDPVLACQVSNILQFYEIDLDFLLSGKVKKG